jgi:hypothetical protein
LRARKTSANVSGTKRLEGGSSGDWRCRAMQAVSRPGKCARLCVAQGDLEPRSRPAMREMTRTSCSTKFVLLFSP